MKVRIRVTQEDIDRGARTAPTACPIALAVRRALPELDQPRVCSRRIYPDGAINADVLLPQAAQDFIDRYDNALAVEPFEFELDLEDRHASAS
jgi:hypothetical protein